MCVQGRPEPWGMILSPNRGANSVVVNGCDNKVMTNEPWKQSEMQLHCKQQCKKAQDLAPFHRGSRRGGKFDNYASQHASGWNSAANKLLDHQFFKIPHHYRKSPLLSLHWFHIDLFPKVLYDPVESCADTCTPCPAARSLSSSLPSLL